MSHSGAAPGDDHNASPRRRRPPPQQPNKSRRALGSFHSTVSRSCRLCSTSPASSRCTVGAASAVKRGEQSAHLTRRGAAVASSVAEKLRAAAKCDPAPSPCQRVHIQLRLILLSHRSAVVRVCTNDPVILRLRQRHRVPGRPRKDFVRCDTSVASTPQDVAVDVT